MISTLSRIKKKRKHFQNMQRIKYKKKRRETRENKKIKYDEMNKLRYTYNVLNILTNIIFIFILKAQYFFNSLLK